MECCSAAEVKQYGYTHAGYWKRTNVKKSNNLKFLEGHVFYGNLIQSPVLLFYCMQQTSVSAFAEHHKNIWNLAVM